MKDREGVGVNRPIDQVVLRCCLIVKALERASYEAPQAEAGRV